MDAPSGRLPRWVIVIAAIGCVAGLFFESPQHRFVAALVGAASPLAAYCLAKLLRIAAVKARRRNWLQFSLRGLLALVVICSIGLVVWDRWLRPAREQKQFIAIVVSLGGSATVDHNDVRCSLMNMADQSLADLASLPGRRYVTELYFGKSKITDDGLIHLLKFPELTSVGFDACLISDDGIDTLLRIRKLHSAGASRCQITDKGILKFQAIPKLHAIGFQGCPITDDGVAWLAERPELKNMSFMNTQVTAAQMADLRKALPYCNIVQDLP